MVTQLLKGLVEQQTQFPIFQILNANQQIMYLFPYDVYNVNIKSISIHQMINKIVLVMVFCIALGSTGNACFPYLQRLAKMYVKDKAQFNTQISPYALLSGKNIDDLGYPDYCNRNSSLQYSTVQAKVITNSSSTYSVYLGFCFVNYCTPSQLNEGAQFIIDFILEDYKIDGKATFVEPTLSLQFSPTTLITCFVFSIFVLIAMAAPILEWIQLCKQTEDEEYIIKSTYIDLEHPNKDFQEDQLNDDSTFLQKLSLKYKWTELWKDEESTKIKSFTIFRFIAVPILIYGEYFYLTNKGAFNYMSFNEQIYSTLYAKAATFAYYIPDVFFLMSGYLISKKMIKIQENQQNKVMDLIKVIAKRFGRLYPIYIAVFVIYWLVTPGLHAGPVWFVYKEEAAVCNSHWWSVLLLVDNWFSNSCYPALWYVQVQMQFTFVAASFFLIYYGNKTFSYVYLSLLMLASWVLIFVLSADLVVEVDIAVNNYTQLYFRSFYSHLIFYLFGVFMSLLSSEDKAREFVKNNVTSKAAVMTVLNIFATLILVFVILRPFSWQALGFELGLCRTGILFSFVIFFLPGMFIKELHTTNMHKFGHYVYPIILASYMIAQCAFWAAGSFPYVSGVTLLNLMIPVFIISLFLGIFLGLLYDLRTLFAK